MPKLKKPKDVLLKKIPVSPNNDYRAGSDGQIYSRTLYAGFGVKECVDWYPLKGHIQKKGYQTVSLCHQNEKITASVHRLICMAFHGLPKTKSLQVRHLDGNPKNNKPINLKWGTQAENWQDRRIHGTASVGEKHWASKLSNKEREHLRWAIKKGLCSQRMAAKALGLSQATVSAIVLSKPGRGSGCGKGVVNT